MNISYASSVCPTYGTEESTQVFAITAWINSHLSADDLMGVKSINSGTTEYARKKVEEQVKLVGRATHARSPLWVEHLNEIRFGAAPMHSAPSPAFKE